MLTGRIPPGLLSAPHLESLHLSGNKLEGPIPAVNSTALRRLRLGRNSLNGTVPWDSMVGLWHLGLDNNRLTGSLPPVLGNLTNLQVLWLDSNGFVGEIPPQISQLNQLRQLRIGKNSLNGLIPLSISEMQNVSYLDLEGNNLHGPIPDSIRNLSCLDKLLLGNNQLSGRIPVSISELPSLRVLDMQGNNLRGPIPDSIGNLCSLMELQLGSNRLSGPIPSMPQKMYMAFLHECTCGPIILLDLCSKSILLKSMDVPQISDIELCSLMHSSKSKECMAALDASSVGYVPPEYGSTKRVTAAGNVYSFGVVLLELVTGKPAVSEGSELTKRVLSISERGNGWDEILDSSVSETSVGVRNQMVAVVKVALACINISPEMRPNSATVLQMLQSRRSNNQG